jgi:hypothetical protein
MDHGNNSFAMLNNGLLDSRTTGDIFVRLVITYEPIEMQYDISVRDT